MSDLALMSPSNAADLARTYWLSKLSGELPETSLIADFVRPTGADRADDIVSFELPDELAEHMWGHAGNDRFALFTLLLAAIKLVLHRYTTNSDLIVGSPAYLPEASPVASNNLVALRTEIKDELRFKHWVENVARAVREAYRHQATPFAHVVDSLGLSRNGGRWPIFDVVVLLEGMHDHSIVKDLENDLTVAFRAPDKRIAGMVRYRADVFKKDTIARFLLHVQNALVFALEQDNPRVSEIPLLAPQERVQLLRDFNDTARQYPLDTPIHTLFEEQVAWTPDRIAVAFEDTQLSYREVNESANRIAALLIELGLQRNEFVGVLHGRNPRYMVCILAALKAGGAFVPIDAEYPRDRVCYMLMNSSVRCLLSESAVIASYGGLIEDCDALRHIILSDRLMDADSGVKRHTEKKLFDQKDYAHYPKDNANLPGSSRDLCYMIYTSGSTGAPKGAMVRHDGAVNHIYGQFEALQFTPDYSFIQSAPTSSDISIWQYLGPILIGGKTIVVDTESVFEPERFFRIIKERRATIIEIVPVVLRSLLEYICTLAPTARTLPDLQWMMATGEAVSVDLVNWWLQMYPAIKVVNAYGPSEASDDVTQMIIAAPFPANQRNVPIGRPLANCRIYILDQQLQPVPVGIPGEICVAGVCVGDGYWQNEAKTKASFPPVPFPEDQGQTMYRTGDLGRWLPDGTIEFLGRIDHQVKVRGFRIELGEIETVLRQHPGVRAAVALVREDVPGVKRIVVYLVPRVEHVLKIGELRQFLGARLPDYMVPAAFVLMDELPLTPNGKIDRRALPTPDASRPELEAAYVAPRTPLERQLAALWAQALRLERVGVHDDFFALGGDSILSIQIAAAAGQCSLNLRPSQMFQYPTIAVLAAVVTTKEGAAAEQEAATAALTSPPRPGDTPSDVPLVQLEPRILDRLQAELGEIADIYPLSPAQQGIYLQCLLAPRRGAYIEQTSCVLQGKLDPAALARAWQRVTDRYAVLRTGFARKGLPKPLQIVYSYVTARLDQYDWRDLTPQQQDRNWQDYLTGDQQRGFKLDKPPLSRLTLVRLTNDSYRLLLSYHHLLFDGWSEPILFGDLCKYYNALQAGRELDLPATQPYRHYIAWLERQDLSQAEAFWRRSLAGFTTPTRLRLKRSDVHQNERAGFAALQVTLSAAMTDALQRFARHHKLTLNTILQAAWGLVLSVHSAAQDVVYAVVVSGREADLPGIESMVGLFVNPVPVRLRIAPEQALLAWLKSFQADQVDTRQFEYSPLSMVQRWSEVPQEQLPLCDSLFVLANYPNATLFQDINQELTMQDVYLHTVPDFPITLFAVPGQQCVLRAVYATDLFDTYNMEQLLTEVKNLVEKMVNQPDQPLSGLLAEVGT